jgi:EpsI family protein
MAAKRSRCYAALTAVVLLASGILAIPQKVIVAEDIGIRLDLPSSLAAYTARDVRFCHNDQCAKTIVVTEVEDRDACPACGSGLHDISLAEKIILPQDTVIRKKQYTHVSGDSMFVTIVLSGAQQKSLHRPQQCLPAQGYVIESNRPIQVNLPGREPLKVALLGLRRSMNRSGGEQNHERSLYAYWFVGGGRETSSHLARLYWMSKDRIVRGMAPRWAYITVSTSSESDSEGSLQRLSRFIAELYAAIGTPMDS